MYFICLLYTSGISTAVVRSRSEDGRNLAKAHHASTPDEGFGRRKPKQSDYIEILKNKRMNSKVEVKRLAPDRMESLFTLGGGAKL